MSTYVPVDPAKLKKDDKLKVIMTFRALSLDGGGNLSIYKGDEITYEGEITSMWPGLSSYEFRSPGGFSFKMIYDEVKQNLVFKHDPKIDLTKLTRGAKVKSLFKFDAKPTKVSTLGLIPVYAGDVLTFVYRFVPGNKPMVYHLTTMVGTEIKVSEQEMMDWFELVPAQVYTPPPLTETEKITFKNYNIDLEWEDYDYHGKKAHEEEDK
jgi:hypothetical protein